MPNQNEQLEAEVNSASREPTSQLVISCEYRNGSDRFVLRDDRGLKIRGVSKIQIDQTHGEASWVTIRALVHHRRGAAMQIEADPLKNNR